MAILIHGPGCATAIPDLHSPVIVVGRDCEHIRDRGRDHHSAQRSNQKYSFHFSCAHRFLNNRSKVTSKPVPCPGCIYKCFDLRAIIAFLSSTTNSESFREQVHTNVLRGLHATCSNQQVATARGPRHRFAGLIKQKSAFILYCK